VEEEEADVARAVAADPRRPMRRRLLRRLLRQLLRRLLRQLHNHSNSLSGAFAVSHAQTWT
jgi:hypothetical protein